jgi:hypothetical protein
MNVTHYALAHFAVRLADADDHARPHTVRIRDSPRTLSARANKRMLPAALGRIETPPAGTLPAWATRWYAKSIRREGNERMPLRVGSALVDGVFHWQPAAGFLGDYDLRDSKTGCRITAAS